MDKTAVFPGSFDPFTRGHQSIVERAVALFDKVYIGIGVNSSKKYLFDLDSRKRFIEKSLVEHKGKIEVVEYSGLTVDFCMKLNAGFIVRGIRNSRDFHMEYEIASMNRAINKGIETVFLASEPEFTAVNSTIVREIIRNNGDASSFLPEGVDLRELKQS